MKTFFPEVLGCYQRKHVVGSGSESQVWLYEKLEKRFAVKYGTSDPEIPEHPNICKVIEKISLGEHSWTVMEYLGCISIFEIVQRKPVEQEKAKEWFRQICEALSFVHGLGIAHCDIKCENVMIHKKKLKIIDWGFSTLKGQKPTARGSFEYCAPEVYGENPEDRDVFACDVWSAGVVFFCMLFSFFPFSGRNVPELLDTIKSKRFLLEVPRRERDFFFWLFQRKPRKRPTLKEILEHEFVKQT
ncbi:serine/threonine protein kinase [Cannes 8 virus]|nr:serine/threonine protein kinase [Cannes 8 virus]AVR52910.1 serine/threonine protein kinase [Marseillevirus Shanghai 1]